VRTVFNRSRVPDNPARSRQPGRDNGGGTMGTVFNRANASARAATAAQRRGQRGAVMSRGYPGLLNY
jgi:hypothetical protein